MYNNSYEEYIRSVLGYPNNVYQNNNFYEYERSIPNRYDYDMKNDYLNMENRNSELEEWYPEIYKIVYPMVKKVCQNINGTVTKDDVDRMVDELYANIEGNNVYDVNINVNNNIDNLNNVQFETNRNVNKTNVKFDKIETKETRMFNGKRIIQEPQRGENRNDEKKETNEIRQEVKETRQFNRGMSDIIRILLLRELIGRPGCCGRPTIPPPPPGRPPFPPSRPPFNRNYENGIYEY